MTDIPPGYNPQQPPPTAVYPPGPPTAPPRKRKAWPWIVGSVVGVILLCCGIGLLGNLASETDKNAKPAAAATSVKPTTRPPTTAAPTPAATTAAPPPVPPKPVKVTYKALSERQWKLIAKNPDAYTGKTYIVYGVVTQFDSATGDDSFRADVGGKNMAEDYEYETNTLLAGSASMLTNLVEGDEFRASATVVGSVSYETQIGGNTTVPRLNVAAIKVL